MSGWWVAAAAVAAVFVVALAWVVYEMWRAPLIEDDGW